MFYAPNKRDADNKWGEFLNEFQWNALKDNYEAYYHYFDEQRRLQGNPDGSEGSPTTGTADAEAQSGTGPTKSQRHDSDTDA